MVIHLLQNHAFAVQGTGSLRGHYVNCTFSLIGMLAANKTLSTQNKKNLN